MNSCFPSLTPCRPLKETAIHMDRFDCQFVHPSQKLYVDYNLEIFKYVFIKPSNYIADDNTGR